MKILEAEVRWATEQEGCLEVPFSGIQPSFLVAGDLIMSRVERADGGTEMERGGSYRVRIVLPYGTDYADCLAEGMEVRLQVGDRVIGLGEVLSVR